MKKTTLLWTAVAAAAGVASILLKRRGRSHRMNDVNAEPASRGGSKHRTDVFSRAKSGGEGTNQPA